MPTQLLVLGSGHAAWQEGSEVLGWLTICRYNLIYPRWSNPHHYLRSDHKAVSLPTLILSTQDFKFGVTGRRLVLISARSLWHNGGTFRQWANATWHAALTRPSLLSYNRLVSCWHEERNVLRYDRSMWGVAKLMSKHWMKSSCYKLRDQSTVSNSSRYWLLYIPKYMVHYMSYLLMNS